jgi:Methyltransferase domain
MNDTVSEIKPGQSIELLKQLHILTRDGKMNQDSRRKLKQVYHLYQFIEPLLKQIKDSDSPLNMVDHGAGKSYLGFIIYDLFFKSMQEGPKKGHIFGTETRTALIDNSKKIAASLNFQNMSFLNLSILDSINSESIPEKVDIVTALHACDTATDDAIQFAIKKNAKHIVLIPCCQAEVAATLKRNKSKQLANPMTELWRHPIHTREFGSHVTNVFRCIQLEAYGYQVTVTEFVGLEHSLKNELIIATRIENKRQRSADRLHQNLTDLGLEELKDRFSTDY